MECSYLWLLTLPAALALAGSLIWLIRFRNPAQALSDAQTSFKAQQSELRAIFLQAAGSSGKPRGLRWKACQWSDQIEWVRDKQSRQLLALVGVTISFEAIEGGDMEGVEAVGNLRDASAVFVFDREWKTSGRVIFNLGPAEAVEHFKANYERC
jgi:hypothetical protein